MKIAITAASGKLGAAVIDELLTKAQSHQVIGLARNPKNVKHSDIEVRPGDYNDKRILIDSLKGVDRLLLVSGMDHPEKRIQQHRNVIEAAKLNGVEKIVYTSIFGADEGNAFSPVVASNRKTESDIINSGMNWVIGRNGIYIEPDLEYLDNYKMDGAISNCAGEGKCAYTSRTELAHAYSSLILEDRLDKNIFNLLGEPYTQSELADSMNRHFGTRLIFENLSVEAYRIERIKALGEFLGTVIGGIYEGIRKGAFNGESHFEHIVGRKHKSLDEMIKDYVLI